MTTEQQRRNHNDRTLHQVRKALVGNEPLKSKHGAYLNQETATRWKIAKAAAILRFIPEAAEA